MAVQTILVQLKKPTKKKHKTWSADQREFARCTNDCLKRIQAGERLTSKNVPFKLKSAIKSEAIRKALKAIRDEKKGLAKTIPTFKSSLGIRINNQNWNTVRKNEKWYIAFTTNDGKKAMPIVNSEQSELYFPYLTKEFREHRGTIELFRKGTEWYIAIPIQVSSELKKAKKTINYDEYTPIGVDLGLRHIAVASQPQSGERQFFSGKEVGYKRRHFRSLRRSLGKKKAQRAIERVGKKESRWMKDYNRKLAKDIVDFALKFDKPIIKLEELDDIRKTAKSTKKADRTIHSWAFYQLKMFINERAAKFNVPVVDINPYKTSQKCSCCAQSDKRNRDGDKFRCVNCGYTCHADLNAGNNIALSTSLAA